MPGGDGTGPAGMGPMTGRAAGFCAGYGMPGYANPLPRAGLGRGFRGRGGGRGRGHRHWFYATGLPGWARAGYGSPAVAAPYAPPVQQQTDALKAQAEFLEQQLEDVRERLSELEAEQAEK